MRIAIPALALVLCGCAYTQDSTKSLSDWELCEVVHDRGSISGLPEKNAQAELDARGKSCQEYIAAKRNRAPGITCISSPLGNSVRTNCY